MFVNLNGQEKFGEWKDGKRLRWISSETAKK
jgi:hypothetical protein